MENIKWISDPAHSELMFKAKHLMITTVTGYFRKFEITAETENAEFSNPTNLTFATEVDSIDTNNSDRDNHLKSADFFHGAEHSKIIFSGAAWKDRGEKVEVFGDLTIKGVTKGISFFVEPGGTAVDFYGQTKAGFTISGAISRKDFGLVWNATTDAGNVVVGDEVKFIGEIQMTKQS
jgi:polyisoprenoid-binding protein YceI